MIFKKLRKGLPSSFSPSQKKNTGDSLYALPSAEISLEMRLNVRSSGRAAICIHDTDGVEFANLIEDTKKFLEKSQTDKEEENGQKTSLSYQVTKDAFGYVWIVLQAENIGDLVAHVDAIGEDTTEKGFQSQILAYVFEFSSENDGPDVLYLIYNQKQGAFYPFVPLRNRTRNTDIELKVFALMKEELAMQKNFELWYPMWDMPLRN